MEKIGTLPLGDILLRSTVPAQTGVGLDDTVRFAWDESKVILFDKASGVSLRHAG